VSGSLMRVVNVAVGFPPASVAVDVIRVYHGGSSWVGVESMRKECSYRAVKKKIQWVVSRERGGFRICLHR